MQDIPEGWKSFPDRWALRSNLTGSISCYNSAVDDDYTRPDPRHAALLTIDVQQDFSRPGAPAEIPGTCEILPQMQQLARAFREAQRPLIHVVRLYLPDGSNADLCRRRAIAGGRSMVTPGDAGAELVPELRAFPDTRLDAALLLAGRLQAVAPGEWLMYKPRWGAFYQTPLEGLLRDLQVNTVVIAGCNFPNCPRATVYEASERDLRMVLVTDAVSGLYPRGSQELQRIGVALWDTAACLQWLT